MKRRRSALSRDAAAEIERLRARLQEFEDTLDAIRHGRIDALVDEHRMVFTREGAERPYRVMVEAMSEGAVIADARGAIRYCNRSFTEMVETPLEAILGASILTFVEPASRPVVESMLAGNETRRRDVGFRSATGRPLQALLSANVLDDDAQTRAVYLVATDVTGQRELENQARNAEIKYRSIFEHSAEGIFQVSPAGAFLGANPAMARLYGYDTAEQLLEAMNRGPDALYVNPGRKAGLLEALRAHEVVAAYESQVIRADGTTRWISENVHCVHDAGGRLQYYEGNALDITPRKAHEDQLEQQATHDALTGLANRRLLQNRLTQGIERAEHSGRTLTVAYIDLDKFKFVNDSLGHNVGDRLLMVVGERLRNCLREHDTLARQGGDEFVLILERSDQGSIPHIMERLLASVAEPMTIDQHEITTTCSIGYSVYPTDGDDADTLLKNADAAMYLAKDKGRNGVQAYTQALNREIGRKVTLEAALRRALKRGELSVCYQPQIAIPTNAVIGAEALLRWAPAMADQLANDFIPLAEDTGLIVPIGEWVLRTACAQCQAWQAHSGIHIAVNLSPRQFREKGLVQMIASVLKESGLAPERLELEITEGLIMNDVELAVATLTELRAMGIRIALDDFGVGHSSLGQLRRLPVDVLKVDGSFMRDIGSRASTMIPRTIINLGHSMGLRVIAEGVETQPQLDYLREAGCDGFQGFLASKAVPPDEFAQRFLGLARRG